MKYYELSDIIYCFPCCEEKFLLKEYGKGLNILGVMKKFWGKKLSQDEADELLSTAIMRHPFIRNSMWLKITVYETDEEKNMQSLYLSLTIKNSNFDNKEKCVLCPIEWGK